MPTFVVLQVKMSHIKVSYSPQNAMKLNVCFSFYYIFKNIFGNLQIILSLDSDINHVLKDPTPEELVNNRALVVLQQKRWSNH